MFEAIIVMLNGLSLAYILTALLCFIYSFRFEIRFFERIYVSFYWAILVYFDYKKYLTEVDGTKFKFKKK